MEKVPETKKSDLEKAVENLQAEINRWKELGMSLERTEHTNQMHYILKMQVQTIINIMLKNNLVTEDDFNLEFKTILAEAMQEMREKNEPQIREQRRRIIMQGAKADLVVPEFKLLGPDGKDIKL